MESTLLFANPNISMMEQCLSSPTEDLIFEDNFANEIYMKFMDESTGVDIFSEMERDEKMYSDELQSIDEKIDLPINDLVTSVESVDDIIVKDNYDFGHNIKHEQLLMEFNSILNEVDYANNEITPPQSPPTIFIPADNNTQSTIQQFALATNIPNEQHQQYEIYDYQQQQASPSADQYIYVQNSSPILSSAAIATTPETSNFAILYDTNSNQSALSNDDVGCNEIIFDPVESIISSPSTDIQRELEVVEELVRAHSRQTTTIQNSDYDDEFSMSAFSSSPRSEYSCSSGSSTSSSSRYYGEEQAKKKSSSGSRGVTKKRSRGYGRQPEEKKSRKKEQNKNAATRYRLKKKQEVEVILDEEKILMDKHRKLSTNYKDTKREVRYLKSLLRELFKARGFI